MIGMLDHKMDVERKTCLAAHGRDDRRTEGNVIDEMPIHDVAVNPIGAGCLHPMDFVAESREIGGQNGWGDDYSSP